MPIDPSTFNHVTHGVLGAAIEVHRTLGPGLLESIYLQCMQWELSARRQPFIAQHSIPLTYKGRRLDARYQIDLIVEDLVVVEIKAVTTLLPVYAAQTLTYMRLTECPVGLLINFNVPQLMSGVTRLINPHALRSSARSR
jgi:GxxExxY protein